MRWNVFCHDYLYPTRSIWMLWSVDTMRAGCHLYIYTHSRWICLRIPDLFIRDLFPTSPDFAGMWACWVPMSPLKRTEKYIMRIAVMANMPPDEHVLSIPHISGGGLMDVIFSFFDFCRRQSVGWPGSLLKKNGQKIHVNTYFYDGEYATRWTRSLHSVHFRCHFHGCNIFILWFFAGGCPRALRVNAFLLWLFWFWVIDLDALKWWYAEM